MRHSLFTTAVLLFCAVAHAQFEARHVHPVALTPDGAHLLAVNSPDASLSIFDVTNPARPAPMLVAEIAVGLEPVSVKARTPDEFWVVNELSDSVSIVSLSGRRVIDTLPVPDEPADVTFAAGRAFVTCSRNNLIRVFDATTRLPLGSIPLTGLHPRALTASTDGSRLYAAFLFSGNGTTILPRDVAGGPPPPPL
jgi:DNA-binding beta-propeller fold protein YncE